MKYLKHINESLEDNDIVIVESDDWGGIYYKGKLINEGHSLSVHEVLQKMGFAMEYKYMDEEEYFEHFGINGRLPKTIDELIITIDSKKYNL